MKGGKTWYCMRNAWAHPACIGGGANPNTCQRASTSHAVHHAIATRTLSAPMKKSNRCGAAANWRAEGKWAGG